MKHHFYSFKIRRLGGSSPFFRALKGQQTCKHLLLAFFNFIQSLNILLSLFFVSINPPLISSNSSLKENISNINNFKYETILLLLLLLLLFILNLSKISINSNYGGNWAERSKIKLGINIEYSSYFCILFSYKNIYYIHIMVTRQW